MYHPSLTSVNKYLDVSKTEIWTRKLIGCTLYNTSLIPVHVILKKRYNILAAEANTVRDPQITLFCRI